MLPFKVFSFAVLVVMVSSQGLPGSIGGAGMSSAIGGAGMASGIGGARMPSGMSVAGMPGGMGGAGMPGGMNMLGGMGMMGGQFMNADMMDTLSDLYGSNIGMPGFGSGFGFGSGLGNFPNPRPQFPMGQFLPQPGVFAKGGGKGRPPTQTFTGIGAIVKTISGIGGGGFPGAPTQTNPNLGQATNNVAYFPRTSY